MFLFLRSLRQASLGRLSALLPRPPAAEARSQFARCCATVPRDWKYQLRAAVWLGETGLKQFPRATHRRKPLLVPEVFADLSASGNFFYCAINADRLDISNRE